MLDNWCGNFARIVLPLQVGRLVVVKNCTIQGHSDDLSFLPQSSHLHGQL